MLLPLVLLLCAPVQAEQYKGFARGHALITAAELNSMLDTDGPQPTVLAAVGRASWLLEHIPGALHTPRKRYMNRDGMTVDRDRFQAFARDLGIDNDTTVVIYDEANDAAHLWWLFRRYGKADVRVLDGGLDAWKDAGYNIERGPGRSVGKTGNFSAAPPLSGWTAAMADIEQGHADAATRVWDARSLAEWDGSRSIGGLPTGRIDGAQHLGWKDFRKASAGRPSEFRSAAELDTLLTQAGIKPEHDHIFYCHSGVRAATPLFALYLMGFPEEKLHLYDGSWIEWSQRAAGDGEQLQ
ncbi:MAG: rhodanese-like domain-containing protein [Gammaproteobacteria bacterium]|nr:rhodanese-like domain-containing protein [Gammaproteobacteria bacterium]